MKLASAHTMSAPDYLVNARRSLDALGSLLQQAAAQRQGADQILADAMTHLREAQQILASTMDDEGTE